MNRFYGKNVSGTKGALSKEESKHCALILRHKVGDQILLMDGKGGVHEGILTYVTKNECCFEIVKSKQYNQKAFKVNLIIAPTKNIDRMEWLVEKLVEIGVDKINFITTQNSERRKLRIDRLERKAVSAMKQSGNPFLTEISEITSLEKAVENDSSEIKLIGHVSNDHSRIQDQIVVGKDTAILIGPEGDFIATEVEYAISKGFTPISLGSNTLRTETAGFAACCHINFVNKF